MRIAVLALQGDFAEHEAVFKRLNVETCQLRQKKDLEQNFDALVLPGGESTVQGKLLRELDMFNELIRPMFGQIRQHQEQNNTLTAMRDALLPKLMSGEVDISAIQI